MSISIISPNKQTTHNENHESTKIEKRFISGPVSISEPLLSPNKRQFLKQMSPNVTKKYKIISNESISKPPNLKESKFQRPQLPTSLKPLLNKRSKTTLALPSSNNTNNNNNNNGNNNNLPFTLRRSNSLINRSSNSETSISDRFIPSRHNSITGKLDSSTPQPAPNASPETHIKAQSSKIYQHHVAEACGLEMNSRILLYQPAPPERKKPINLLSSQFNQQSSKLSLSSGGKNSLPPSIASARAKKIPSAPERVLDAPGIVDDFYLNLLAWSSYNLLAIGLEDAVYVWNASTGSVGLLCELPEKKLVTSVKWSEDGSYVSIGKDDGLIEIWDIEKNIKLRTLNCDNHLTRIASQSWNQHILTSGSRVGNLYHSDVRVSSHIISKLENSHSSEICGIEYNNQKQFVTGGNDNVVNIWDIRNNQQPIFVKNNHKAAVKALSWCPYQSSLLATGGGSTDKTINFWNTTTGARVNTIETGSQISSLNWGYAIGTGMEIVATHGYPTNSISLFSYPTLQKTGEITNAHDTRILNGCLSPDNLTLATVAGDENLKFWSLFDLKNTPKRYYDEDNLDDLNDKDSNEPKRMKRMMNLR
ncbi:slp1 [Candida jiufengensis]|uniref:slp1 n=1 Tax=Candida jiufengensis TaxID=497108 RepID=UPI002224099C|nr:slp1 [Candida jiufengensis]KAI5956703.1 slp1 [Candida jiufengensis]